MVGLYPPVSPTEGIIWWNSENGVAYVYYTDLNSSQWVSLTSTDTSSGAGLLNFPANPSTSTNYVSPSGTTYIFNGFAWDLAPAGSLNTWKYKIANYTAATNDRIIANSSSGTFTITLPSTPANGNYVQITDGNNFASNNVLVNPNGNTVEGYSDNIALDLAGVTYEFIFSNGTWQLTATTGAQGTTGASGPSGPVGPSGINSTSTLVNGTYTISLQATGNLAIPGHIIPDTDLAYDLGSTSSQWRSLYVGTSTIYLGGTALSVSGGSLTVDGSPVTGGDATTSTLVNGTYTVSLSTTGNLTLTASGIITAPNNEFFKLQAKDTNSLLRNEINLDPNNGTYMSVWSEELNTAFSAGSWATASWVNEGGVGGAYFTNAEDLQDFWTTGIGSFVNSVEVSINGGVRTPVQYDGNNGGGFGVTLLTDAFPVSSPTTITSLVFYYRTQSKIEIDYDGSEILLDGQALNINLQTTNGLNLQSGQTLDIKNIGQQPVRIFTDNTTHVWEFDSGGSLTLPREGRITGIGDGGPAGDRYGYISWDGNSSGDGSGFNTMRLVPDLLGLEDLDQYIIIDPTGGVPGHIHIRAGGTQDNSLADLYLGGENSHVKISAGANPPVTVMANSSTWTFGTDGLLTLPSGNITIGNFFGNDAILCNTGTTFGIVSQGAGASILQWLDDTNNPTSSAGIAVNGPNSNTGSVQIFTGIVGTPPQNTWTFGTDGSLTLPIGVSIDEYNGSHFPRIVADTGKAFSVQGQGSTGSVALQWIETASTSSRIAQVGLNKFSGIAAVTLTAGTSTNDMKVWRFDETGTLTFPDGTTSTGNVVVANSSSYQIKTNYFIVGNPYTATFEFDEAKLVLPGNGVIKNQGSLWQLDTASQSFIFPNNGKISYGIKPFISTTIDDLVVNAINTGSVYIRSGSSTWTFGNTGSLTFPDSTVQTTAYKSTSGSWTLATGSNTVSITVPLNGNYQMWVNGNIPNGIVEWNATVNVSNPNVPAIGSQYAWYYAAGNALVLTAIPDQIVGTAGVISTSTSYVGTTANVFTFGITNNSTSSQVIDWGYTTL